MKYFWLAVWKVLLSVEFAFAGSTAPMTTHLEQVSAMINGQMIKAQTFRVQMPAANSKVVVMDQIAVSANNAPAKVANFIAIQSSTELNGVKYVASVREPLAFKERQEAFRLAQNQVDYVRRNAPPMIANKISEHPIYQSAVPTLIVSYDFRPSSPQTQELISRTTNSAATNSDQAFQGLIQQEQQSNQDARRYVQAINEGRNISLQLQKAALQSTYQFTQALTNFSQAIGSLQDRQLRNLAQQIAQSDPVLENILTDNETETHSDIRRATADVSPLNPQADANRARYGERFRPNGLLKSGLFAAENSFPPTPTGHRILESANLLSDAVALDPSLSTSSSSVQLVGASYVYLNAAIQALAVGRADEAQRYTKQGRQIARALRGEQISDDLEHAIASSDRATEIHEQAVRETLGVTGEGRSLLAEAFNKALPTSAEGKAAAALGRSLVQDPHGLSDAEVKRIGLTLLDTALGMIPIVSPVRSLIYMAAGRNLITGEGLSSVDYALCAIDVISLGATGPFAKVAGKIPELMGLGGSAAKIAEAMRAGTTYVKNFGNFVEGSVKGIRDLERVAPGFALKNFLENPGAVLALGQNVTRYGGAEFATQLTAYAAKKSLSIVETAHISSFAGGFTKIVTAETFAKYGTQAEMLAGKEGGRLFAIATHDLEAAAVNLRSDADLARYLGVPKPESGFVRLDFEFDLKLNPGLPNGSEAGVNEYFKLGGKTSGGFREIVVDPLPMSKVDVIGTVGY